MKFKVGDRVNHGSFGEGKIIAIESSLSLQYLVEFDKEDSILHNGNGVGTVIGKSKHCWWCYEHGLQLISNSKQEVHIYVNGKITTAILKENGKVLKKSEAKCSPSDEFNFEEGAKLVFGRLFKRDIRVGDIVKAPGRRNYPYYSSWFKETKNEQFESHFVNGSEVDSATEYEVVAVGKHALAENITVLAIQNPYTTQVFVIDESYVERVGK